MFIHVQDDSMLVMHREEVKISSGFSWQGCFVPLLRLCRVKRTWLELMRGEGNPSVQFASCPVMALECDYILIEKGMFFFLIITKVLLGPRGYVLQEGTAFIVPYIYF